MERIEPAIRLSVRARERARLCIWGRWNVGRETASTRGRGRTFIELGGTGMQRDFGIYSFKCVCGVEDKFVLLCNEKLMWLRGPVSIASACQRDTHQLRALTAPLSQPLSHPQHPRTRAATTTLAARWHKQ